MSETTAFITMGTAPISRRSALRLAGLALGSVCARSGPNRAYALKPGKPSKEKLLKLIRDEKTPEEIEANKELVAEERRVRLEKQRELQAAADRKKAGLEEAPTDEKEIESNLRGQYYYPTARKRYLPRVKLAWECIPSVEDAVRSSQWGLVKELSTGPLTDAFLPMKLYASSLGGGGLNINSKFIEKMTKEAESYEKALKKLATAVKKKDSSLALNTLTDMKGFIDKYRVLGHIEADDFGIGEIPMDKRVGSGFGNNNSVLYRKNKGIEAPVNSSQ